MSKDRRHTKLNALSNVVFPDCGSPTTDRYGATANRSTNHVLSTKSARTGNWFSSTATHCEIKDSKRRNNAPEDS